MPPTSVADLHSKILDAPPGSKFFQFPAVFGKIWQNRMLAPPGVGAPASGKSGIRHCPSTKFFSILRNFRAAKQLADPRAGGKGLDKVCALLISVQFVFIFMQLLANIFFNNRFLPETHGSLPRLEDPRFRAFIRSLSSRRWLSLHNSMEFRNVGAAPFFFQRGLTVLFFSQVHIDAHEDAAVPEYRPHFPWFTRPKNKQQLLEMMQRNDMFITVSFIQQQISYGPFTLPDTESDPNIV